MSVNSQNFAIAVDPYRALAATTGAGAQNGVSLNLESLPIGGELGFIGVLDVASTSTVVFKLQGSADGTNWTDIPGAVSPSMTAVGAYPISIGSSKFNSLYKTAASTTNDAKYARLVATTTGSATVVYGVFTPFQLAEQPTANSVAGTDYTLIGN